MRMFVRFGEVRLVMRMREVSRVTASSFHLTTSKKNLSCWNCSVWIVTSY